MPSAQKSTTRTSQLSERELRALHAKRTREAQEKAFAQIQTIDWWFRRKYNLAPTDPRYLDMTRDAMTIEYWCHKLSERLAKTPNTIKIESLSDLLDADEEGGGGMSDEEFDEKLHELEMEDSKHASPASRAALSEKTAPVEQVINFRSNRRGR